MKKIKFCVDGEPMGKQRPKARNTGKFIHIYTPSATGNYENRVRDSYKKVAAIHEFEEYSAHSEISATIIAYYQIPKSHYKFYKREKVTRLDKEGQEMLNGTIRPTKKPDTDNIAKIILDSLNGVAYVDDSRITTLLVMKYYSENPRVEVILEGKEDENVSW